MKPEFDIEADLSGDIGFFQMQEISKLRGKTLVGWIEFSRTALVSKVEINN